MIYIFITLYKGIIHNIKPILSLQSIISLLLLKLVLLLLLLPSLVTNFASPKGIENRNKMTRLYLGQIKSDFHEIFRIPFLPSITFFDQKKF